jgi:hypothetical protein
MTASYSAILLVHLSDSKAKLRHAAYLYLTPVDDVIIATAPVPAWHHSPSQWMVHTFLETLLVALLLLSSQR